MEHYGTSQEISCIFRSYTHDENTPIQELIYRTFYEDFDGFYGCCNTSQYLASVWGLIPRIAAFLGELGLEFPVVNTRPLVSFSSKKVAKVSSYWKVPAHQDWPSVQGSLNGVTCWCPLVDIPDELGPLEVIPGSHLCGYLEHREEDGVPVLTECPSKRFLRLPMQAGDVLFFSSFTIHRSGQNISERIRYSMHFRFDDIKEKSFINRKYPKHRTDVRKAGIISASFPSKEQIYAFFNDTKY